MGMASTLKPLTLVGNPGSASRKYALYDNNLSVRARLHFEYEHGKIVCNLRTATENRNIDISVKDLADSAKCIEQIFNEENVLNKDEVIGVVGLRVVAPSTFFTQDNIIDDDVIEKLEDVERFAPIHVGATLKELKILHRDFKNAVVVGVSDSNFHLTKPSYAWNYAIKLEDADKHDIKRFGYHGTSMRGIVDTLKDAGKLTPKVIACHLGSGSSISAIKNGKSLDTTMGFSPLEGVVMSTRSGSIGPGAVHALRQKLGITYAKAEKYLHEESGLLGLGGSNDIRELIEWEAQGDIKAKLALETLVHSIQKAIGSMAATLNGVDAIVFTGTVGERSATIRKRILERLQFLDFQLDSKANNSCTSPSEMTNIAKSVKSKPIFIIPADESATIAKRAMQVAKK